MKILVQRICFLTKKKKKDLISSCKTSKIRYNRYKHTALVIVLLRSFLYINHPYIAAKTKDRLFSSLLAFFREN